MELPSKALIRSSSVEGFCAYVKLRVVNPDTTSEEALETGALKFDR